MHRCRRNHHLSKLEYYTQCANDVTRFSDEFIQFLFFFFIQFRQFRTVSEMYNIYIWYIDTTRILYIYYYIGVRTHIIIIYCLASNSWPEKKKNIYKYATTGSVPNTSTFKGYFSYENIRLCQNIRETHRCTYYYVPKRITRRVRRASVSNLQYTSINTARNITILSFNAKAVKV